VSGDTHHRESSGGPERRFEKTNPFRLTAMALMAQNAWFQAEVQIGIDQIAGVNSSKKKRWPHGLSGCRG
jgi:hypothetical protein